MTPEQRYQQDLEFHSLIPDSGQKHAVALLQRVYDDFVAQQQLTEKLSYKLKLSLGIIKPTPVKGLYLWGGVGIGKTYLMDVFFECLPTQRKLRSHFHVFMQQVHQQLKQLQGTINPLQQVAINIKQSTDIICFDEFFVSDIGDAVILAGLFAALFQQGVSLVATSNIEPDELYKFGLQRNLFLPAIDLLKQNTQVFNLQANQDYRMRSLTKVGLYFHPLNELTAVKMRDAFAKISMNPGELNKPIIIEGRQIMTRHVTNDIAWFDFDVICNIPRSQNDYIEIAHQFRTVLLSGLPKIKQNENNKVTYFINLIDVFYDAKVKLIISANVPINEIYTAGEKIFEFQRTQSRLQEMQSKEYLSLPHHTL